MFEQGPIRPPSEANSLLIRATRNCPWNRCRFCPVYKGSSFSRRTVEEIKSDIMAVQDVVKQIKLLSFKMGCGGSLTARVAREIYRQLGEPAFLVARWLFHGGESVFLQDANTMIMKTSDLIEVLKYIKFVFPEVKRITCYARSSTVIRKTADELSALREAGLTRVHVGMESGCDEVLAYMEKGTNAKEQIASGKKIRGAGLELTQYIMPGLGGRRWSEAHAHDTAVVLNAVQPDFIRLRSLVVFPNTGLKQKMSEGDFQILSDDEVVKEIRVLVENLRLERGLLLSDHFYNLLEEVEGCFPGDKEKILATIDFYLSLPVEKRLNYRLGRRSGVYRHLEDMNDSQKYSGVEEAVARLNKHGLLQETMNFMVQQI